MLSLSCHWLHVFVTATSVNIEHNQTLIAGAVCMVVINGNCNTCHAMTYCSKMETRHVYIVCVMDTRPITILYWKLDISL